MKSSTKAFRWIIEIFRRHNVTFQVSGGLAATAYGSSRPVRDFDFDITNDGFEKILPELKSYIVSGPQRHKSNAFENFLLKLKYKKQSIDIAGSDDAKIYDAKNSCGLKIVQISRSVKLKTFTAFRSQ